MFRLEDGSFAKVLPDEEVTLPASVLDLPGLRCLIAREEIEVKDDSATNRKSAMKWQRSRSQIRGIAKALKSLRTAANINHQGAHVAPFYGGKL